MIEGKHYQRLASTLSKADGQEQYLNWFKSEMTQTMLAAARELAHPRMTLNADPNFALQENGRIIGANQIIDFFTNPPTQTRDEQVEKQTRLKPTYGADEILKEQRNDSE